MEEKTVIDRAFGVPRGAEDQFQYSSENETNFEAIGKNEDQLEALLIDDSQYDAALEEEDESVEEEGDSPDEFDLVQPPENFEIIDQTLRRAPGGQQVVDVVVDITDAEEATNYEFQIIKL